MRHNTIPILTAIFLLVPATLVFAQPPEEIARHESVMNSPAAQQMQLNVMQHTMGSLWSGNGSNLITMELLRQNDFREGIGVSSEQVQRIQSTMQSVGENMPNDPAIQPIQQELRNFMEATQGGPFAPNATPETQQRFFELQANLQIKVHETALEKLQYTINTNLMPDQLKKVREFQMSAMSDNPMIVPGMFEALDLSDPQKERLDELKKEIEPDFKKNIEKMAETQWKLQAKVQNELGERLRSITDPEERKRIVEERAKKIQESDPELQREMRSVMESSQAIANRLKSRMTDVLTDEQRKRMTDLIDNPPDYIKKITSRLRAGNNGSPIDGVWQPGQDSWKPGDPIPAEFMETPKARFPRRQN